jgi:S1-C subfamily serine protease
VAETIDARALDAYSEVVTRVAETLLPSVASLRVMARVQGGRRPRGEGSAVVLSADGLLLTSAHVVERASGGVARFPDGRELEFDVVGADRLSDLAVIRVQGGDLEPAVLGDADHLRVGQLVVAVGNPLGFAGSVSAGVVSAVGRSFTASSGRVGRVIDNVIQTDAALHPGNSGGALADSTAQVVGISTAVIGPGIGQGLGMAVPINTNTQQIISTLVRDGRVRRAYLGVAAGPRPLPPRVAQQLGRDRGVEVTAVMPNTPAAQAGLRAEDAIVTVDGVPVEEVGDLQRLMVVERIGQPVPVEVVRGGDVVTLELVPAELRE